MNQFLRSLPLLFCLTCVLLPGASPAQSPRQLEEMRNQMVDEEIVAAGVKNERVIQAMRDTPRHEFVPRIERKHAYYDMALPIGAQQTISPPFVVAYMTEQIDPQPTDRVLEIGTGSGYQAAVLSPLVSEVYSIEIVEELGRRAARTLRQLKYSNVHTRVGDGFKGWPEAAPFDKIIVTCSPEKAPQPLVDQLKEGGKMVIPVGARYHQNLYLFTKKDGKLEREALRGTFFVPMTGEAEARREVRPDPSNPSIENGGFEVSLGQGEERRPEGWYYLRQAQLVTDEKTAPEGKNYLLFTNEDPGRGCRALQSTAIDGRQVERLAVSFHARGKAIRYGATRNQWPYFVITFYDKRRAAIGSEVIGPFEGTFSWTPYDQRLPVPLAAREAIVRIGLLGAVGELAIDRLAIKPVE